MSLRKKLFSTFGGLGLFTLLLAGMTFYVVGQWRADEKRLDEHYQRSLKLERIRVTALRAFREVTGTVKGNDPRAREEFDRHIESANADLAEWFKLARTKTERAQVGEVSDSLKFLVHDATRVFTLVESGDRKAALALMEGRLEDRQFARFDKISQKAVASDLKAREKIRAASSRAQNVARLTLLGAAVSTVILSLLLAAYLGTDLFAPLKTVEDALNDAAKGDRKTRLDEERGDEIGRINVAFNGLMEAQARREQMLSLTTRDGESGGVAGESGSMKIALHTLISNLRGRVAQLKDGPPEAIQNDAPQVLSEIDALLKSVERVVDFGMPLDLDLARTDVRALLYELILRFHDQLLERGVNLEIECDAAVKTATFDRLKIREALSQCVKAAVGSLPENGGKIAVRARLEELEEGSDLVLEFASDGNGDEQAGDSEHDDHENKDHPAGGDFELVRATLRAHGGDADVQSSPDKGTYVALRLPYRK